MKFENEITEYLNGSKFSANLALTVAEKEKNTIERINYLVEIAKGKKIIHLGFTDHVPLIRQKIASNSWLHKLLVEASEKCIGIDINCDAVEFVKSEIGISEVYCHDITSKDLLPPLLHEKWDYLILGEILEHIDNPVLFLNDINKNYGHLFEEIVITVPNAFDLVNIKQIFKRREFINSDHRFWFTPYTLSKVVTRAEFEIIKYHFCQLYMPKRTIERFLINRYPNLREGLILHARAQK